MVKDAVAADNGRDLTTFSTILQELIDANLTVCPVDQQGIRVVP